MWIISMSFYLWLSNAFFPLSPPCYILPILGLPVGATEHQARAWAVRLASCPAMTLRDPKHVHQLSF